MTARNLALRFETRAVADPMAPALCFLADGGRDARRWNRGELLLRSQMVAGHLSGVAAPGSRIVLIFDSGLEFAAAFIGCLRAGLIPVPVSATPAHQRDHGVAALARILRDCSPDAVLTQSEWLAFGLEASLSAPTWIDYDTIDSSDRAESCVVRTADDIAFLQYTSGSTGNPKGVMIGHGNLHDNIGTMAGRMLQWNESATVVSWLPMYHDLGLIAGLLQALYVGAQLVFMSPRHFLSRPTRWLEAMSQYRGAFTGAPNFAYELVLRIPETRIAADLDLSNWRVASNCAEPVRASTLTRFVQRFAPYGLASTVFAPCYGLAEATVMVTAATPEKGPVFRALPQGAGEAADPGRAVSSGTPNRAGEVVIVDPQTCRPLVDGEEGEIWVSGASVALGYWRKPEATQATFRAEIAGDDRHWLRTGDLGRVVEGELFVGGRLKDLILIRGKSIHPEDVEELIQDLDPRLKRGAGIVIGTADDCDGEALIVVQEARGGTGDELAQLAHAIRREVARIVGAEARHICFVRAGGIPKTANGKLRRGRCREMYLSGDLPMLEMAEDRSFDKEEA